jgi:hypothetical protein
MSTSMRFLSHPALARSGTVDQVLYHQLGSLLVRKLRQRHSCPQHDTHVGDGQRRQLTNFQLLARSRVPWEPPFPVQFGLRHKPRCQNRQSQVMFPGAELLCLQLVPANLGLGFLGGSLDKVTLAVHPGQFLQRRFRARVTEGIPTVSVPITTHHQPLFRRLSIPQSPDASGSELGNQLATLAGAHPDPYPLRVSSCLRDRQRFFGRQHSRLRVTVGRI